MILKIVLLHMQNTLNYGSAMMGINFSYYFNSIFNNDIIYLSRFIDKKDLNRIKYETLNNVNIKKFEIQTRFNRMKKPNKILYVIRMIIYSAKDILSFNPIGIIVLGGDDLSEDYSISGLIYSLYHLFKLSQKTNVFLVSQTIGPFRSWREQFARFCLKRCQILSRDHVSANYIKNDLNLKNVFESSDLAFLDLPRQNELNNKKEILEKYGIAPNNYITLIPSGLVRKYTNSYTDYLQAWSKIVIFLAEIPSLKSKKIVLLAHVLTEGADDRKTINQIRNKLYDKFPNRIVYITDVLLPSEARIILGNGIFTITGRMHGAISTFQMLKPAISLSYSVKYKGVIGENLGMNDLIIEARSDILWSSDGIVELVMGKVEYVLRNYDELISRIKPAVNKNKKMAMAQIEYVAEKLEGLMK